MAHGLAAAMTVLQALDWSVVWSYAPSLLQGLLVSLALTGIGFVVGGVGLGTLLAAASRSSSVARCACI